MPIKASNGHLSFKTRSLVIELNESTAVKILSNLLCLTWHWRLTFRIVILSWVSYLFQAEFCLTIVGWNLVSFLLLHISRDHTLRDNKIWFSFCCFGDGKKYVNFWLDSIHFLFRILMTAFTLQRINILKIESQSEMISSIIAHPLNW